MANENFPNGEKKNVPLITKSMRGAFNWRSSTASPNSACINQNVYLNLIVKYYWIDDTKCYLEVGWEPWYLNESEGQVISQRFTGQDNNFSQNKSILTIGNNLISLSDEIKPLTSVSDCNMLNGNDTPIFQGVINVTTSFDIAYYYEYTNGEITYYIDLNTKHKLKISKPGRYDDNIVFNKEGLNELIDNIKKYPITDIETVEAKQWGIVSDGQPSIKVIHGNKEYSYAKTSDANIISGKKYFTYNDAQNDYELVTSPNINDLNNYYESVNYKYVKVGSNITFDQSQKIISEYVETDETQINNNFNYYYQDGETYILIETQEGLEQARSEEKTIFKRSVEQQDGTFRVNVNTDTYEVPVKGIENIKVHEAEVAKYYSEDKTKTIEQKFNELQPPIIIENLPIAISTPVVEDETTTDENEGLIIEYDGLTSKEDLPITSNSIIMVAPVYGDRPNEDLAYEKVISTDSFDPDKTYYKINDDNELEIAEDVGSNWTNAVAGGLYMKNIESQPSSWDIWGSYGIICYQKPDGNPKKLYFSLQKKIDDPEIDDEDLQTVILNPKIKININLAIFPSSISFMVSNLN